MLFDFQREQPATFWMKNTLIPLDMIFIRADGVSCGLPRRPCPFPRRWFIRWPRARGARVVAGTARKLGIAPGDRVAHPIFSDR